MGNDEKVLLLGTQNQELIAISEKGKGKRFRLDVEKIPSRGGYYFLLDPGDMVSVIVPVTSKELVVISAQGKALRLDVESIPERGLRTGGVKVMRTYEGDRVVGATCLKQKYIVTMTENAYAKRTDIDEIPKRNRGAAGVFIHKANETTGPSNRGFFVTRICFTAQAENGFP